MAEETPLDWNEIVAIHRPRLVRLARSQGADPQTAEDIAQQTLEIALIKIGQIRDLGRLSGWLSAIAVNLARRHHRNNRGVAVALDMDLIDIPTPNGIDADGDPAEAYLRIERWTRLRQGLDSLDERQQRALVMRDAYGIPIAAVAAVLGYQPASLRAMLPAWRRQVRQRLNGFRVTELSPPPGFGAPEPAE